MTGYRSATTAALARRLRRRAPWILGALCVLCGAGGIAAHAFWQSTDSGNFAAASADALPAGTAPTVTATAATVTVTWPAVTTTGGHTATGYTIARYGTATGGTRVPAGGGCSNVVAATSCAEQNVPDGTWYYTVTPTLGLWAGTESARSGGVTVDTTPPTVTVASISPAPGGSGYDNTSPVTVNLSATDAGSGVAGITYWVDSGTHTTVNAATAAVSTTGDGSHTVTYFATDHAGNSSGTHTQTVQIDTVAPTVPAPTVTAGYYSTLAVPVSLGAATDTGSGVNTGTAVVQRDQASLAGGACQAFPGTFPATVTLSGGHDTGVVSGFCYQYREQVADNAGNVGTSPASNIAKVDTSPPATTASVIAAATANQAGFIHQNGQFFVYANVTDPASGVGTVTAAITTVSSTASAALTPCTTGCVINGVTYGYRSAQQIAKTTLSAGAYTYTVTATDNAGNTAAPASFSVTVDNTGPTVSTISSTNNDGTVKAGDTLTVTFTKNIAAASVNTTAGAAVLTFSQSGPGHVMVALPGLMAQSDTGVGKGSWVVNNTSVTCPGTFSVNGQTVTWTATGTCSPGANVQPGASGTLAFLPDGTATGIEDYAGNTATGTKSYSAKLF